MAILYTGEIRDMMPVECTVKPEDLETELLNAKAVQAASDAPENPGRVSKPKKIIVQIRAI